MTTLSFADLVALELKYMTERFSEEKGYCEAAIAKGDFLRASKYMHDCMVHQVHQKFASEFKIESLEDITNNLLGNLLRQNENPRTHELAEQSAWKEEYLFCLKVGRIKQYA